VSDTTNSVATPAVVHSTPPMMSLAAFWQNSLNPNVDVFELVAPDGAIIDVQMDFVMNNNENGAGISTSSTGLTVGYMYYSGLDGVIPSINYPTVSLTN
jgi:hypothetical protein